MDLDPWLYFSCDFFLLRKIPFNYCALISVDDFRVSSCIRITASIMKDIPTICTNEKGSVNTNMPMIVATTGSIVDKIEALDASVLFSPYV